MVPRLFFTGTLLILLLFTSDTIAMAEGLSWLLSQTTRDTTAALSTDSGHLHIAVTDRETEISSRNEILFIDYQAMLLYRLDRHSGECAAFDLKETDLHGVAEETRQDQKIFAQINSLLAGFSVTETTDWRKIEGLLCNKKRVLLGAGLFRLRTVVPKVVERYGQSFSEAGAEYWVSSNIDTWQALQKFVRQRQSAFTTAPLLRRIDPLGLVGAVGGLPVQGWEKSGGKVVDLTLLSTPTTATFSLHPPQECRGDIVKRN